MTIISGLNPLTFPVPATAMAGNSYARFRVSLVGGLTPLGVGGAGEVEDYAVSIDKPKNLDFGDAPTAAQSGFTVDYPVTLAQNGENHIVGPLFLGSSVDPEANGQPSAAADGDGSDDDGVTQSASLFTASGTSTKSSFLVNVSQDAKLDGWIDFNRDGDWSDTGEQIFTSANVFAGENVLSSTISANATAGATAARFRLSTAGGLLPTGAAADGEVEDYLLTIVAASPSAVLDIAAPGGDTSVVVEGNDLVVRHGTTVLFKAPISSFGTLNLNGSSLEDILQLTILQSLAGATLRFDGGLGKDILKLVEAGQTLDLTNAKITVQDIEGIDITGTGTGSNKLVVTIDKVKAASSTTDKLDVVANNGGTVEFGKGWKIGAPKFIDGKFTHIIVESTASGTAEIDLRNDRLMQNPLNKFDADRDGDVQPMDALRIINELRRRGNGPIKLPTNDGEISTLYFDVSGDDKISALDALQIINALSRIKRGGSAEAESVSPMVDLEQFVHSQATTSSSNVAIPQVSQVSRQEIQSSLLNQSHSRGPTISAIDHSMTDYATADNEGAEQDDLVLLADTSEI